MSPSDFDREERMRALVWSTRVRLWRRAQSASLAKIAFWLTVWLVLVAGVVGLFLTAPQPGIG